MLKRSFVFVDASAWIALIDASDGCHARASTFWRSALEDGRQFLTSDYVLDETYTLLRRRRRGLRMAVVLHELVVASEIIDEVRSTPKSALSDGKSLSATRTKSFLSPTVRRSR